MPNSSIASSGIERNFIVSDVKDCFLFLAKLINPSPFIEEQARKSSTSKCCPSWDILARVAFVTSFALSVRQSNILNLQALEVKLLKIWAFLDD
jgi:hypothetical protein